MKYSCYFTAPLTTSPHNFSLETSKIYVSNWKPPVVWIPSLDERLSAFIKNSKFFFDFHEESLGKHIAILARQRLCNEPYKSEFCREQIFNVH